MDVAELAVFSFRVAFCQAVAFHGLMFAVAHASADIEAFPCSDPALCYDMRLVGALDFLLLSHHVHGLYAYEGPECKFRVENSVYPGVVLTFHSLAPLMDLLRGSEQVLRDLLQLGLFGGV